MQPVIMRQLAADHIREIDAKAEDEHRASEARRVRRRALSAGLSGLARKFVGVHSGQAARAWGWFLSWASIRRSRSPRSVRVKFQVNGRAMAL